MAGGGQSAVTAPGPEQGSWRDGGAPGGELVPVAAGGAGSTRVSTGQHRSAEVTGHTDRSWRRTGSTGESLPWDGLLPVHKEGWIGGQRSWANPGLY